MVIDASIAFKWIVAEDDSGAAIAWIGRTELIAPTLIHAEVGNALWKRLIKGQIRGAGEVAEQLENLSNLVRTIDETPVLPRALELAVELAHPIYDCVYLALAEVQDDALLTADRRFANKVLATSNRDRVKELSA